MGVVQAMDSISDASRRIGEIIHVVESVAFQTHILAVNAAPHNEQLDATQIARDDACLRSASGRTATASASGTVDLSSPSGRKGASASTAPVAQAVNQGQVEQAQRLMHSGSAFAGATQGVVVAIRALQVELRQPA